MQYNPNITIALNPNKFLMSMKVISIKKATNILWKFILVAIFISSCSFSSSEKSIFSTFNEIDTLIELQEFKSAEKLLSKTAKKITNPIETLGIIKRLYTLQKDDFAKTYIKESLESFPDNLELLALYSNILINEKKYDEAKLYAQKLEKTQYGSIYSELRFITDAIEVEEYNKNRKKDEKGIYLDFYSTYYVQAYADIYNSTENEDYLKNIALIYALQGDMKTAFEYHPKSLSAYDDSSFWALISYDSYNFEQAIHDLQQETLTKTELELFADSYTQCTNIDTAYKVWEQAKEVFTTQSPISYHNAALYNYYHGNIKKTNEIVLEMANTLPYYTDGLSLYCELAKLEAAPAIDNSPFSNQLKEKGLSSLEMTKAATIPVLDIQAATKLLNNAIPKVTEQNETELAKLLVEKTMNSWQVAENTPTAKQKIADVWLLLESNQKEGGVYNPVLVQFATWFFLTQQMYNEAEELFSNHCSVVYANNAEVEMKPWEYETAAYLALVQERYIDAQEWLLALMPHNSINSTTPFGAALNLAQLQYTLGSRNTAINLYEQMLQFELDKKNRSEVYYRAANILYEIGENKKAIYSLENALSENPAHSGSQVLLKRIKL